MSFIEKDYSLLQPGDILFTFNKKALFSKLIVLVSRKDKNATSDQTPDISHVLIYLGDGLTVEATFNGVVVHSIKKHLNKHYNVYAKRYIGDVPMQAIKDYVETLVDDADYSFLQLVVVLLKKIFHFKIKKDDVDEHDFVCSEFGAEVYLKCGIDLLPGTEPAMSTPMQLYNSRFLKDI